MVDVAGNMSARASGAYSIKTSIAIQLQLEFGGKHTKSSWNTDNNTLASQFFGDVDLVAGRVFDEVDVGDGIADFDKGWASRVEEGGLGAEGARHGSCEAAGGEHCDGLCLLKVSWEIDGVVLLRCYVDASAEFGMRWSFLHLRCRISSSVYISPTAYST